ncbi:hypothetical protein ACFSHP_11555 [Novosphingobium panipatense]
MQQKEAGIRHDLIDAVFALGCEDDLVRLLARVQALQAFVATEDGRNLLAGYKRAANILKRKIGRGWNPRLRRPERKILLSLSRIPTWPLRSPKRWRTVTLPRGARAMS